MKTSLKLLSAILGGAAILWACNPENLIEPAPSGSRHLSPKLPTTPYEYEENFLAHGGRSSGGGWANEPTNNLLTDQGATLGRVLFYDEALSYNNSVSCANCHKQEFAFADPVALSSGFEIRKTKRNSPSIQNAFHTRGFFWDLRAKTVEEQVTMPIKDHIEMGIDDLDALSTKLSALEYYADLFEDAFGDPEITPERVSFGLAQFLRAVISRSSKYDDIMDGQESFSAFESRGQELFIANCQSCHWGDDLGGMGSSANIGLDETYEDTGVDMVNNESGEHIEGWFKIPSLRNVAMTAPYMHDGRFRSLEEVVRHYNSGVKNHPDLSIQLRQIPDDFIGGWDNLKTQPVKRMNMSEADQKALVAFLHTLTDEDFLNDTKYSNPFVY